MYKGTRGSVQDVAIKMLNYNDELQLQQFCVEIQLLKSLSFDRNIVQFYGACLHDEHPMLVSLPFIYVYVTNMCITSNEQDKEARNWYRHVGRKLCRYDDSCLSRSWS